MLVQLKVQLKNRRKQRWQKCFSETWYEERGFVQNVCFPCGLVRYVSEPGRFMNEDILEYQGTYYTLSDTKMPFKADKTVDDDYFILTLYALAMEARNKGITLTGKDVVLGVGLPPADYGQQATSFKKYFLDHAKHGITFKMNGTGQPCTCRNNNTSATGLVTRFNSTSNCFCIIYSSSIDGTEVCNYKVLIRIDKHFNRLHRKRSGYFKHFIVAIFRSKRSG